MLKQLFKSTFACASTIGSSSLHKLSYYPWKYVKTTTTNLLGSLSSVRCQSSSSLTSPQPQSENDIVNTDFCNRNPRNLEMMNLAKKIKGWRFQYPDRNFYHRLVFISGEQHTEAHIEHISGKYVITATTKERAISRYLHSTHDVAAAENIGRIIAQRCKESGITTMSLLVPPSKHFSQKFLAFHEAVLESGISLEEEKVVLPKYQPGIDYDNTEEVENLTDRQARVRRRGDLPRTRDDLRAVRSRARTKRLQFKNINRNRGYTTQGRLLGFHMIFHKHMK